MDQAKTSKIIANNLKRLMQEKNVSNSELSKVIGVSESTVGKWLLEKAIPRMGAIEKLASYFHVNKSDLLEEHNENEKPKAVKVPVLGRVAAGVPIEAIEDIIDYEEIPEEMARQGEYFGLKIQGDSMYPRIIDGDVVIVRKQSYATNRDIVIVLINGDDGTCKQYYRFDDHIELKPFNPMYKPLVFSKEEVDTLPVQILGKVVELRGKF